VSSQIEGQFLARRNAGTLILHAIAACGNLCVGEKTCRAFQTVAQVNPTAQNTFLFGPHFSSFLAFSSILPVSSVLSRLWTAFSCSFCSVAIAPEIPLGFLFSAAIRFFSS
jgi:hypothetical protein